jgi:hypothetical protein
VPFSADGLAAAEALAFRGRAVALRAVVAARIHWQARVPRRAGAGR